MKIAYTSRIYNKKGGISRYVAEHAERFANEHEVHVFASEWTDVGNPNIIFHRVPILPKPLLFEAGSYFIEISFITKLLKNFDIVHTEGLESIWVDIVTAHSIHAGALNSIQNGKGITDRFLLGIESLNYQKYRNYRKIICVSNSSKQELMKYYGVPDRDIVVIPNGVNPDEFYPTKKNESLIKKYGINKYDFVIVIVATEFARKGVSELIQAVSLLKKYDIKLLVVGKAKDEGTRKGDTYYKENAQSLGISKNVVFTGMVDDLNAHYNLGDIFVLPTKYEAFGIPTLEAMSCGLPIINSKIGAGELITDGHDGLHLTNPNNIKEIADKIEILILDENMRIKLGISARKTAMKYSWDIIAKQTMEVYESSIRFSS